MLFFKRQKQGHGKDNRKGNCYRGINSGTEALRILFEGLPMDCPGIVVWQHMPENFTKAFAQRLNTLCCYIKEASNNDSVLRGQVLIAREPSYAPLKEAGQGIMLR